MAASSHSYDVFINFRGVDTRENFVSLLYNSLVGANICAYRDSEDLWKGEEIAPALLRAIQNSKISIPVFSKNYANSKYCLLELAQIWKCQLSDGQIVIPIFIDVEPRDVRYQTGSFQEPFEKYQRNHASGLNGWKNALTELGSLSGWTLKGNADPNEQLDTVKSVIQRVLGELHRTPLEQRRHIIGVDSHVVEVLHLLDVGSDNVRFVGICGMGGLGKTTIAEVVRDRIGRSFNRSCFLRDVNQKASEGNSGLIFLQKKLLRDMLKKEHDISDVSDGESLISQKLCEKNVLLILDDVATEEQLVSLAGGLNWFGLGSKVIITTRDKHILNVHEKKVGQDIQIYVPEELNPENALHLFSLHAFSKKGPPEKYRELSCEVVNYAGGLPLTLEVLGSFLIDKTEEEWKDTLERLKDIKKSIKSYDDKVFAKLMISYNTLGDPEKTIFLDIACNFSGWKKETLIFIWEACELQPRLAIKELIQKHLLKINKVGKLKMHDQLRYLGRRIALKDSPKDPTKHIWLWSQDEILKVLEIKGTDHKMVEGILIDEYLKFEGEDVLKYEDFEKMPNLRFLQVKCGNNLNGDFLHLPSRLKWFTWGGGNVSEKFWENVPANFCHEELVYLELSRKCLRLTWNDTPQNKKKHFKKLKILILYDCLELSFSANFSWFPCLQSLEINSCSSLLELPDCICQMCPALKSLILCDCKSFNKLPKTMRDLKHLVKLSVKETNIEEVPDGVGQLENLEELDVSCCHQLVQLPTSMGTMRSLQYLNLEATLIVKLPDDFSKLPSLEVFRMGLPKSLDETSSMNLLPVQISVSGITHLRKLYLSYPGLESLPDLPLTLSSLEVEYCHSLQMIPDLSHLEKLEELIISVCRGLEYIVKLPSNLIHLSCSYCYKLKRLPDLSNLKSLKKLNLYYCIILEEICGLEGTESLEELNAKNCWGITETTKAMYGKGRLKDNFGEGRGTNYSVADDEIHNISSPILVFVFTPTPGEGENDRLAESVHYYAVSIIAYVRRGEKRTRCINQILTGDIDFGTCGDEFSTNRDIIYIHYLKEYDWFGFPLESKDAIEELTAKVKMWGGNNCCPVELKFLKVLFPNKDSDQRNPDKQYYSDSFVEDFFQFGESDEDDEDDDRDDENDGESDNGDQDDSESNDDDQDDGESDNDNQDNGKFNDDHQDDADPDNDDQDNAESNQDDQYDGECEKEERKRPSKRAIHHDDDEASGFPSNTEEAERSNRTIDVISTFGDKGSNNITEEIEDRSEEAVAVLIRAFKRLTLH